MLGLDEAEEKRKKENGEDRQAYVLWNLAYVLPWIWDLNFGTDTTLAGTGSSFTQRPNNDSLALLSVESFGVF